MGNKRVKTRILGVKHPFQTFAENVKKNLTDRRSPYNQVCV